MRPLRTGARVKTQKQAALGVIEREWHAFQKRLDAALPKAFDRPVFSEAGGGAEPPDRWRLRDLLAHLAFWQDLAAQAAERMAREHVKPGPDERLRTFVGETRGVDEVNRDAIAASGARGVDEVRGDVLRAHVRLVDAMRACPDELLWIGSGAEDLVGVLRVPAVVHLRTHTPHIDVALEKEGATTV
jgi:hypothetical protein